MNIRGDLIMHLNYELQLKETIKCALCLYA